LVKWLAVISVIGGIILFALRRWFSESAEKKRLLKAIRKVANEMQKYTVGSDEHNRLRANWLQLNREYADLNRHS